MAVEESRDITIESYDDMLPCPHCGGRPEKVTSETGAITGYGHAFRCRDCKCICGERFITHRGGVTQRSPGLLWQHRPEDGPGTDRDACPCCGADGDDIVSCTIVDHDPHEELGHRIVCDRCGHATAMFRTGYGAMKAWRARM